jgi:RES domain-containing protein
VKAFRIALRKYGATARAAFGGASGYATDGRWHSHGRYLDYAAESQSLAVLERLVHYKRFDALQPHVLYVIDIPAPAIRECDEVPRGWNEANLSPATQSIGNRWCDERVSPALRVPSAVTSGEFNLLLNSRHPGWKWTWVIRRAPFAFDERLRDLVEAASKRR